VQTISRPFLAKVDWEIVVCLSSVEIQIRRCVDELFSGISPRYESSVYDVELPLDFGRRYFEDLGRDLLDFWG
jgi:hypothetical protein